MMTSFTREVEILPNAPPMMTPTAISITLPRAIKVLNSPMKLFFFSGADTGRTSFLSKNVKAETVAPHGFQTQTGMEPFSETENVPMCIPVRSIRCIGLLRICVILIQIIQFVAYGRFLVFAGCEKNYLFLVGTRIFVPPM